MATLKARDWLAARKQSLWFAMLEVGSAAGVAVHAMQGAIQHRSTLLLLAYIAAALVTAEGMNRFRRAIQASSPRRESPPVPPPP